jgi:hypothetical protein
MVKLWILIAAVAIVALSFAGAFAGTACICQ